MEPYKNALETVTNAENAVFGRTSGAAAQAAKIVSQAGKAILAAAQAALQADAGRKMPFLFCRRLNRNNIFEGTPVRLDKTHELEYTNS